MVHSLKFQGLDKPPVYSSKYIRTSGFKEEDRLGRGKFWPGVKMEPVSYTLCPRSEIEKGKRKNANVLFRFTMNLFLSLRKQEFRVRSSPRLPGIRKRGECAFQGPSPSCYILTIALLLASGFCFVCSKQYS
jgi:hypothetical protein